MDAATARDHWSRCRHRLRLQSSLPLSLILSCNSRSQWICNDRAGFCIRDGGWQIFKTTERSGSDSNAGCVAGYNATRLFSNWGSSGCLGATTACTWSGGWCIDWWLLWSGRGGSHALSDIFKVRTVQRRWGGGVLTLDCRGYGIPSLRGIPLASRYANASLAMGKLRNPQWPTLLLILTMRKTSNTSYDQSCVRVSALGRDSPI